MTVHNRLLFQFQRSQHSHPVKLYIDYTLMQAKHINVYKIKKAKNVILWVKIQNQNPSPPPKKPISLGHHVNCKNGKFQEGATVVSERRECYVGKRQKAFIMVLLSWRFMWVRPALLCVYLQHSLWRRWGQPLLGSLLTATHTDQGWVARWLEEWFQDHAQNYMIVW